MAQLDDFDGYDDNALLGNVLNGGAKVAGAAGRRAGEATKKELKALEKSAKTGLKATLGVWYYVIIAIAIVLVLLIMASLVSSISSTKEFTRTVSKMAEDEGVDVYEVFQDAGKMADMIERNKENFQCDGFSQMLDAESAILLLRGVDAYNKEMQEIMQISYTAETVEAYDIPFISTITGAIDVIDPEIDFKEIADEDLPSYKTQQAIKQKEEALNTVPDNIAPETINNYMYGITQDINGLRMQLEEEKEKEKEEREEAYAEAVAAAEARRPVYGTITDTTELSRFHIESESNGLENPYYIPWQPVIALATVVAQDNYSMWGGFTGEGSTYTLSADQIDTILKLFGYEFLCYDSYLTHDGSALPLDYCLTHNAGYQVDIRTYDTSGGKKRAEVRRIPKIAPMRLSNGFVTYEYVYKKLTDSYYELVQRDTIYNSNSFLLEAYTMDEQYETDRFLHYLELLPYTEDMYLNYKIMFFEEFTKTSTTDKAVCPSIGTYVHVEGSSIEAGTGFTHEFLSEAQITQYKSGVLFEGMREKVIDFAYSRVGYPYSQTDRASGTAYDCSSFCYYAWREGGVNLGGTDESPPVAATIAKNLVERGLTVTSVSDLCPGDLIFWGGTNNGRYKGIDHVAMYVGNNATIEAYGTSTGVVYKSMSGRRAWCLMCHVE